MSRRRLRVPLEKLTEAEKIDLVHRLRETLDTERREHEESLRGIRAKLDAVEWALARAHVEAQALKAEQGGAG